MPLCWLGVPSPPWQVGESNRLMGKHLENSFLSLLLSLKYITPHSRRCKAGLVPSKNRPRCLLEEIFLCSRSFLSKPSWFYLCHLPSCQEAPLRWIREPGSSQMDTALSESTLLPHPRSGGASWPGCVGPIGNPAHLSNPSPEAAVGLKGGCSSHELHSTFPAKTREGKRKRE